MKHYYDVRRQKTSQFKKKKKVFLLRRNIKIKRSSEKLNHRKLRSFKISKKKESLNYELELSKIMRIYSTFHVSLLKKVNQNVKLYQTKIQNTNETKYEVEKILEKALIQSKAHYLIK